MLNPKVKKNKYGGRVKYNVMKPICTGCGAVLYEKGMIVKLNPKNTTVRRWVKKKCLKRYVEPVVEAK